MSASASPSPSASPAAVESAPEPGHGLLLSVLGAVAVGVACGDYLPTLALFVLILVWRTLGVLPGPPVVALALTFQWTQVTIGMFYGAFTGRVVPEMLQCEWRPMVLIGLGCVLALGGGILLGRRLLRGLRPIEPLEAIAPTSALASAYIALALGTSLTSWLAFQVPQLTQIVLALGLSRYALLFLLFRRALRPRLRAVWFVGLLLFEIGIGFTGYFAGFREAFMMAGLALIEAFDRRRIAHWFGLSLLGLTLVGVGVFWTGIKQEYRRAWRHDEFADSDTRKLDRVEELAQVWLDGDRSRLLADLDQMVSRAWAVYYPALAVARVPAVLPHSNGEHTLRGLEHVITPRIFFPEKGALASDSDLVRRYSGVWVAGSRQQTSIAFGYAAESYVDFGVPLMFVPVFLYALLMGLAFRWLELRLRSRELSVGALTAICWGALYLFERSWVRTIGLAFTALLVLGGVALFVDGTLARLLARRAMPVRLLSRGARR